MRYRIFYLCLLSFLIGPFIYAEPFFTISCSDPLSFEFTEFGKAMVRCLNLEKDITPTGFMRYAQNRSPNSNQDIWEEPNCDPGILCAPEDLYDLSGKFGWIDEVSLHAPESFHCIIIMGGTIPGMRDRIHLVLSCFRKQWIRGTPKICFLTNERPLKVYDGKGFIQELKEKGCSPTESSAARYLWDGIVPSHLKCEFVNTITPDIPKSVSLQSFDTNDVMASWVHWLKIQQGSNSWRVLLVGSQPWLHHQKLVCERLLLSYFPGFFLGGGTLEVIGIAAPSMYRKSGARRSEAFKTNVLWPSIALSVCEEEEVLSSKNKLKKGSAVPDAPQADFSAAVPPTDTK
ncbi:MAG: hypothetical protein LBD40_02605 [Puniceicoccales bacterium]|jgi:hypothetical protein|nr:hypothetical protein [Puniceicoccales bacterium]